MNRLIGGAKKKAPPPNLTDAVQGVSSIYFHLLLYSYSMIQTMAATIDVYIVLITG